MVRLKLTMGLVACVWAQFTNFTFLRFWEGVHHIISSIIPLKGPMYGEDRGYPRKKCYFTSLSYFGVSKELAIDSVFATKSFYGPQETQIHPITSTCQHG